MGWKGFITEGSLEEESLLELVSILERKKGRLKIEVDENNKEKFITEAIKKIKLKFFIPLVKEGVIYILFKDRMFKFSKGYPELETARKYGETMGIPAEKMYFELLFENPFE